ncbi:MAG: hypothetical protein ACO3NK_17005 [Prochlorotrichaceae cyanobacterium]|jgi:hypothetical protein
MPTLTITKDQMLTLLEQLSWTEQQEVLQYLLLKPWASWLELTHDASDKARQAAADRGKNWDEMSEDERETFIDDLVHEA